VSTPPLLQLVLQRLAETQHEVRFLADEVPAQRRIDLVERELLLAGADDVLGARLLVGEVLQRERLERCDCTPGSAQ
jgi:hypothetical protein